MVLVDDLAARMEAVQLMTEEEVKGIPQAYQDGEAGFGALKSERGLFPLRSVKVTAKIAALSSHITLDQTFLNAFDTPLEATYIFPLPSRAAVTSFRLEVKDRVVEGIIKERGEARKEYTQAIQQGHRAAIAEEDRAGVFTIRVGNIGASETASVRLTMAAPLPFTDGEATFRFPLLVAPRYIPGQKLPGTDVGTGVAGDTDMTPDASRISPPGMVTLPGFQDPVQLGIEVEFDSASLPVSSVRSSLHTVMVTDIEAGGQQAATSPSIAIRRLKLDPTGDRSLNRDFILRFHVTNPSMVTASLVLSDDQGGESQEGTWQLTLIAPQGAGNGGKATPRDVAFVIDRSGSMSGWKMVAARSATARMVDTLTDADRFTVLAFDNSIETPPGHQNQALVPATDYNRQSVATYLSTLEARGGTEMAGPLQSAAGALAAPRPQVSGGFWPQRGGDGGADRDRVLVLVTDGQVGNEDGIMGLLAPKLQGVRVFTLGIDKSVNEGFLTRLAALTPGGACELVESQGRLEAAMDRIHRLIATPALIDVQIDGPRGPGIEPILDATTPTKPGAVFIGVPALVSGRYRKTPAQGSGDNARFVTVSAKTAAGEHWNQAVAVQQTLNPALGALWARALIRELDDRYTIASTPSYSYYGAPESSNPDKPDELRGRILALSLRFSVLSRFSAFVAVDREEKVATDGGAPMQITQPVEAPGGWDGGRRSSGPKGAGGPGYGSGAIRRQAAMCAPLGASRQSSRQERGLRAPMMYGSARRERGEESYGGGSMGLESCCDAMAPPLGGECLSNAFGSPDPLLVLTSAPYNMPAPRGHARAQMPTGGARASISSERLMPQSKNISAKPSNPVASCLEMVRLLLGGGAQVTLMVKLFEGLKEVLTRAANQSAVGASVGVLKSAVETYETTGGFTPEVLQQVKGALERIAVGWRESEISSRSAA